MGLQVCSGLPGAKEREHRRGVGIVQLAPLQASAQGSVWGHQPKIGLRGGRGPLTLPSMDPGAQPVAPRVQPKAVLRQAVHGDEVLVGILQDPALERIP